MKKIAKYSLIVAGWLMLGIVFLLLLVSLLLQTRPVKDKLANVAENQAEKFINGNLSIGRIDGNFFTGLILEDILLTYENDTVAYVAELDVSYNLRSLLDNEVHVSEAAINEPYFYLKQYRDSTWNMQKIIKPTEKEDTTETEGMDLRFPDFSISEGTIETEALDTVIPQKIQNINTRLSFGLSGDEMNAELNEFNLSTVKPDFTLNHFRFEFKSDSSYFQLNNLNLKTAMNQISGQAEYDSEAPRTGSAYIESEELQLKEFEYFIPDLNIPAKPIAVIDAEIKADSVHISLELQDQNQKIAFNAKSSNLADYLFENTDEMLDYNLQGSLQNVKIGHWIGNPELDYILNGELSADGRGIDPPNAEIMVKANLGKSVIENKRLHELLIDLEMFRGNLSGMVRGNGEFGYFRVEPDIQNLLDYPVYDVRLITEELDLAQLLGNDSLSSNINLKAQISGESFEPEQITAGAEIITSDSRFREINLDTLVADVDYSKENINIDTLWLFTQTATLTAGGNYNLSGTSDIRLTADFDGIEEFQPYIPVTELSTSGKLRANLAGTADSLTLDANLQLDTTSYQQMTLKELNLDAEGHIAGKDTLFDVQLRAYQLASAEFVIDTVNAQVEGNMDSLYVNADVAGEDINTAIETGFVPGETMRFTVNNWQIDYKNQQWALQQAPAVIEIDSMNYRISNLKLATSDADSAQYIIADGKITRSGEEDFTLELANIDMDKLSKTFEQDFNAGGILNLNLSIDGTAKSPLVKGDFTVNEAQLNEYSFTDFGGSLNYENNQLNFETLIVPEDSGKFDIAATLPLQLNLDTMGYHF
ncbi:MAG: AsmA family protein, partial [Prolixibacteraceae bacterium]